MHRSRKGKKSDKKKRNRQRREKSVESEKTDEDVPEDPDKENLPYNVEVSDIMGRYLVASRDLQPGDLVMREKALVVGPCHDSPPLCLGCYKRFDAENRGDYRCPGCAWPLCGPQCAGRGQELGHSAAECAAMSAHGTARRLPAPLASPGARLYYGAVAALRCLLLKAAAPARWRTLLTMEAHNELRRRIPSLWRRNQELVVDTIRSLWGMDHFSEDEIHTVCGILEVNAFEIGPHGQSARSLFPAAFLMCHDCVPNTSHTDDQQCVLTVRASTRIPQGRPITLSYAYTMQSTLKRREHLQESKFFACTCARCADPTELGTMVGALKCPRCACDAGVVLSTAPLDPDAPWRCTNAKCPGYTIAAANVRMLMDRIAEEVEAIDSNDVEGLEGFLSRYRNVLHDNHYHRLGAKHSLSQLYGKAEGYTINVLSDAQLKRKRDICTDILSVFDVIEPGYSRLRGIVLYELHAPVMILATRRFEARTIGKRELGRDLKKVVRCLEEASLILGFEPEGSSEALMAAAARDALDRLRDWQTVIGKLNA
ncbi:SET domain-containing protein SmydA-8-like [Schistocerca nitens]|uniref:SET domain-containing protein SmydA-8-like n=1 Tax=Schistocerca nitens TaxID=7011 RepID=UPI0021173906|nr:SET domain-containing protein SmydA-8-like [Schistocerca nitens]